MSKKLLIASFAAVIIIAGMSFLRPSKDLPVVPTFGDIIAEAQAASADYFLKIDTIEGESTDDKHKNEIEILSWSWGASQTGTTAGGGGGAGKVSMQDFNFMMAMSKATPKLMEAVARGEHIRNAVLTARKTTGKGELEYLVIELENVLVSSYQTSGAAGDMPSESLSLNFEKITWTYTTTDGTVIRGGWDLKNSTGL